MNTPPTALALPTALSSRMNKVFAVIVTCAFIAGGCANPELTRVITTLTGGVVGALVGKWAGGDKGAFWGGLLGAGFGFVAGQVIYQNQKDLDSRKEVLDSSIADASKVLAEHKSYNKHLEKQIQRVKDALNNIANSQAKGEITPEEASKMRQELLPGIDTMAQEAKQTARTFQDFTKKANASEQKTQLVKEIEDLKKENDKLDELLQAIAVHRTAAVGQ